MARILTDLSGFEPVRVAPTAEQFEERQLARDAKRAAITSQHLQNVASGVQLGEALYKNPILHRGVEGIASFFDSPQARQINQQKLADMNRSVPSAEDDPALFGNDMAEWKGFQGTANPATAAPAAPPQDAAPSAQPQAPAVAANPVSMQQVARDRIGIQLPAQRVEHGPGDATEFPAEFVETKSFPRNSPLDRPGPEDVARWADNGLVARKPKSQASMPGAPVSAVTPQQPTATAPQTNPHPGINAAQPEAPHTDATASVEQIALDQTARKKQAIADKAAEPKTDEPAKPAEKRTLGNATDEELITAEGKLKTLVELHPSAPAYRERLAQVQGAIKNRLDQKTGPVEWADLQARARGATTPQEQAAILGEVGRADLPIHDFDTISRDTRQNNAIQTLKGLFPVEHHKSAEELQNDLEKARISHASEEGRGRLADARAGSIAALDPAKELKLRSEAHDSESKAKDREFTAGNRNELTGELAHVAHEKELDLDATRAARIAELNSRAQKRSDDTARLNRIAAAKRAGRAGGVGPSKDDLKWAQLFSAEGKAAVAAAAATAKQAQDDAAREKRAAEEAETHATRLAGELGGAPKLSPKHDDKDAAAHVAALERFREREQQANGAKAAAALAKTKAAAAETVRQAAEKDHNAALTADAEQRKIVRDIFTKGGAVARKNMGQSPTPTPSTAIPIPGPLKGKPVGTIINDGQTGKNYRIEANGTMTPQG